MYTDQRGQGENNAQSLYQQTQEPQRPYDASQPGVNVAGQAPMPGQFLYRDPAASRRGLTPSRKTENWFQLQSREMRIGLLCGAVIFVLLIGFGAAALFGSNP